jgi:EAL domain-containing protein (putative c-di-GMP-specific phosphodiesterase class I)
VIHLGHTLGMQVVGQGIETAAQLDQMCHLGCELGQGHLLSFAVDPERALNLARLGYWGNPPDTK